MALAYLRDAEESAETIRDRVNTADFDAVATMLERRLNAPLTSSAGRLFDAVAMLAGLPTTVRHEGQAAIELEWLSTSSPDAGAYPFATQPKGLDGFTIDTRMTISAAALDARRSVEPGRIGRRFHATVSAMIARGCEWIRDHHGLNRVVLGGGVFLNVLLPRQTRARLLRDGFDVWHPRQVPCSDAGLALGQLAIAAAWARDQSSRPQPLNSRT